MSDIGKKDLPPEASRPSHQMYEIGAREVAPFQYEYVVHLNDLSLEAIRRIVKRSRRGSHGS